MPWLVAPRVTAASPVRTPARACDAGRRAAHGVDQVQRGADGTLGIVLASDRRAPDGHDRVADELLDRAAVASDDVAGERRSSATSVSRTSSASRSSAKGVKPTRSAKSTLTRRRSATLASDPGGVWVAGVAVTAPATSGVAHSEQNLAVGPFDVPQLGQATARRVAHSEQNFAPGVFSVPQFEQITGDLATCPTDRALRRERTRRRPGKRAVRTRSSGPDELGGLVAAALADR